MPRLWLMLLNPCTYQAANHINYQPSLEQYHEYWAATLLSVEILMSPSFVMPSYLYSMPLLTYNCQSRVRRPHLNQISWVGTALEVKLFSTWGVVPSSWRFDIDLSNNCLNLKWILWDMYDLLHIPFCYMRLLAKLQIWNNECYIFNLLFVPFPWSHISSAAIWHWEIYFVSKI